MKKKAMALAAAATLTVVSSVSVFAATPIHPAKSVTAKETKAQLQADIKQLIQKITDLRKQNHTLDVQLASIPWKKDSYLASKRNLIAKEGSVVRAEIKRIGSLLNAAKRGNNKKLIVQIEGQLKQENNKLIALGKQYKQVTSFYNTDNAKVVKDLKTIAALESQENKNLALFRRAAAIKDFSVAKTTLREAIATLQQIVNTKQNLLKIKQSIVPVKSVPAPAPLPATGTTPPAPVTTSDTISVAPTPAPSTTPAVDSTQQPPTTGDTISVAPASASQS
ncbi:hypothetical protein PP175_15485 [Aneurinibacillus sp. Ricciae_BoGa-3]|uniref:hypothetical protein n=1 Tax=Aneurinibacillus sp. Ricciae_BoGa-3 TaxID=3022697 RepID=UPI002340B428|nr:hypothetical protein [Aneurinibacillus sp. Ricciae_BoGa-3]WCK52823.1 hypothetical protein PP175_15485 [Aneurinibacillus sp. Ricciae_BoGa-3]